MSIAFPEIRVGEPVRHETLAVFPLFAPSSGEVDCQLSHEALGTEAVSVKEVSEAGSVPDLLVENKGDVRVLFIEGEELVGAKQNRILNTSVLDAIESEQVERQVEAQDVERLLGNMGRFNWAQAQAVGEGIAAYLARNPGLSYLARHDERIVGAVLCGHDGRRGYLHHLAVALAHRQKGIGRALVEACLAKLGSAGIQKCNIFLFSANEPGEELWKHAGWLERTDLKVLQRAASNRSPDFKNATFTVLWDNVIRS